MNFFFALNINNFKCSLTIPKFTNEGETFQNISLFSSKIDNNSWMIKKQECKEDKNFFYLNVNSQEREHIFFLGKESMLKGKESMKTDELEHFL